MRAAPRDEALEERPADHAGELVARATRARRAPPPRRALSRTAAASPFMNTERTSLSAAASPGRLETTCTGIPSGTSASANACADGPDASAGVARPRAGTGPSSATSAKRAAGERGQLALERRRRGVQVGVDGVRAQRRQRARERARRSSSRREREHDVAVVHGARARRRRRSRPQGRSRARRRPPPRGRPRSSRPPHPARAPRTSSLDSPARGDGLVPRQRAPPRRRAAGSRRACTRLPRARLCAPTAGCSR